MNWTVESLIDKHFIDRPREEQESIILEGKPRPLLKRLQPTRKKSGPSRLWNNEAQNEKQRIFFDGASYDHVDWMTGCEKRQKLFCWPCLLFRTPKEKWNHYGVNELHDLHEQIESHKKSVEHLQSVLDLRFFIHSMERKTPVTPIQEKELISRNRKIVQRVFDVICFLVHQQKLPRIGTHDKSVLRIEDCLENLQFLRNYDVKSADLIDDATDMLRMRPDIVTDMVDAISDVMKKSIVKETHQSTFVSMILSDPKTYFERPHPFDTKQFQLSTVLRYVKNGEVVERFIGFKNVEGMKTSPLVLNHMKEVIMDYQIGDRLAAYSLDTTLPSIPLVNELKAKLHFMHPFVYFLPCHLHNLYLVLQKSVFYLKECDVFFKRLEAMGSYFREGCILRQLLGDFAGVQVPNLEISKSTNHAEFLSGIKTFMKVLVDFCDFIASNVETVSESDLVKVICLRPFLTDMNTMFLLESFIRLFGIVTPLSEALRSPVPGLLFGNLLIDSVMRSLKGALALDFFEAMFNQFCGDYENLKNQINEVPGFAFSEKQTYLKLHLDITNCIADQIKCRFENASKMAFCRIMNLETNGGHLSPTLVQCLNKTYKQNMNYSDLEREIKLVTLRGDGNSPLVKYESVHQLLKFLVDANLGDSLPSLRRLCELILTLPCTSPNADGSGSSKLDHINSWSYMPVIDHIPGDLSMLCVEQDFLEELRKSRAFYYEVINKFHEKNKSLELSVNKT